MKKLVCAALTLLLAISCFSFAPALAAEDSLKAAWEGTKNVLRDLFVQVLDAAPDELNEARNIMVDAVQEMNGSLDAAAQEWQDAAKKWAAEKLESQAFAFRGQYRFGMPMADAQAVLEKTGCAFACSQAEGMQVLSVQEAAGGYVLVFTGEETALSQIVAVFRDVVAGADAFLDVEAQSKPVPNAADQQRDYQLIEYMLMTKYGVSLPLSQVTSAYLTALQSAESLEVAQPCRRMLRQQNGAIAVDHFLLADPQYSGLQCNVVCYTLLPVAEAEDADMPAWVSLYLLHAL